MALHDDISQYISHVKAQNEESEKIPVTHRIFVIGPVRTKLSPAAK
jgi:hypothetical protein